MSMCVQAWNVHMQAWPIHMCVHVCSCMGCVCVRHVQVQSEYMCVYVIGMYAHVCLNVPVNVYVLDQICFQHSCALCGPLPRSYSVSVALVLWSRWTLPLWVYVANLSRNRVLPWSAWYCNTGCPGTEQRLRVLTRVMYSDTRYMCACIWSCMTHLHGGCVCMPVQTQYLMYAHIFVYGISICTCMLRYERYVNMRSRVG